MDHIQPVPSRVEPERAKSSMNIIWSRRRKRCFESDLGDDPHTVNFPFAFSVTTVVLTGFMLAVTGVLIISASLFLLGVMIILSGLWLYGWTLYAE